MAKHCARLFHFDWRVKGEVALNINSRDLAVFGGQRLFSEPRHVNRPSTGSREVFDRYLDRAWSARRFANDGPLAEALERRLEDKLQVDHVVLMSNGTTALSLLIMVLGLSGEVILPSFTFISTPHALRLAGITPVFCDVAPGHWNIDPHHCSRLINEKTSAIVPTHLWGRPCDTDALQLLGRNHDLPVIYDAAHSFGCSRGGRPVGGFGTAEVFSFHATKAFHTAEGGAVTCADPELAHALRLARNFGFVAWDEVAGPGTNAKMSELSAAMGLANLDAFDGTVSANRSVYRAYQNRLAGCPYLKLHVFDENESNNYWYISAELTPDCPLRRDDLLAILHAENILARRYFYPGCHRMQPYGSVDVEAGHLLPHTEDIASRVLVLPGGAGIEGADVALICDFLTGVLSQAAALSERIAAHSEDGSTT